MDNTLRQSKENPPELAKAIIDNWRMVIVICSLIGSVIFSWSHFQSGLDDLQAKVAANQQQANALNASLQTITPEISAINAKLDILIKHNGL